MIKSMRPDSWEPSSSKFECNKSKFQFQNVHTFFLLLVETWLHNKILKSELNLSEYDIHRRDRTSKKGGGIILCVKKSLNSIFLKKSKQIGMHFCKVRCPQKAHIYINLPLDATDFKIHIKQSSLAIHNYCPLQYRYLLYQFRSTFFKEFN